MIYIFLEIIHQKKSKFMVCNWDSDGIETLSYRPLAVLYYHFIYLIFDEITFLLRNFIIFEAFVLILLSNVLLRYLDFSKNQIIIFTFLIIFSKIFITLIAWFTVSVLIFAYILTILSILFFFIIINKNNFLYYILSVLLAASAIFVREELYVIPIILSLLYFYKYNINFTNLYDCIKRVFLFFIVVFFHIFLRKKFIPEANHLEIIGSKIYYGDEIISLGGFIKTLKSSFLPMGYYSSKYSDIIQTCFSLLWIILILTSIIFILIYVNKITNFKKGIIKVCILILLVLTSCLPHLTIERSFGIFLPCLFALLTLSVLIEKLFFIKDFFKGKMFLILNIFPIIIFLLGILGGIYRSNLHAESMSQYSVNIVEFDSLFIYGYKNEGIDITIPKKRYSKKVEHLENLNITNFNWGDDIKDLSPKIIKNRYHPLSF